MMDSRRARTKPRRVFRSSVNTWNDAIEEAFPLLMNARRWFSLPYLQKKNGIHSNMSRSGTQLNSMASGSCPWRIPNKCYDSRPIMALHEEINDFYNFMSPTPQEHAARRAVIRNIEAVIIEFWPSVWIQVIGSFRTGLYLPTSDINLLVVGSWSRLPLNTLKDALSKKGVCIESCICVVRRTHGPVLELTDKLFDFKIHLSFRSNIGPKSAELIKQYKAKYPALGKLALVLRQFLYQRDLYEVGLGGVSYYGLLMMIVSFLQLHPRPEATTTHVNLGVLLIEFFELYGRKFNYSAVALKTKRGGSYAPKNELPTHLRSEQNSAMLCIEDPLNPFIGLGYDSFSAQQIRQAFTFAYATLNMAMNGVCEVDDFLPQESILGRIVSVSNAVINQRQTIKNNFLLISSAINGLNINSDSD